MTTNGHIKLDKLTLIVLQRRLPKEQQVSNWESELSDAQLQYAALDVIVCIQILAVLDECTQDKADRLLDKYYSNVMPDCIVSPPKNGLFVYMFKILTLPGTMLTPFDIWLLSVVKFGLTKQPLRRFENNLVSCSVPMEMIWFDVGSNYKEIESYLKAEYSNLCVGGEKHAIFWDDVKNIFERLCAYMNSKAQSWITPVSTLEQRRMRSQEFDVWERKIIPLGDIQHFAKEHPEKLILSLLPSISPEWKGHKIGENDVFHPTEHLICLKTLLERGQKWTYMYNQERLHFTRNKPETLLQHFFTDTGGFLVDRGITNQSFEIKTFRSLLGFDCSSDTLPQYWTMTLPIEFSFMGRRMSPVGRVTIHKT